MTYFLGLDPGTLCGFALLDEAGERLTSGTWNLKPKTGEGPGMRLIYLETALSILVTKYTVMKDGQPILLGYEAVKRHAGTDAAHVYGALTGKIMELGEKWNITYATVPVGTVKRVAIGKGVASKTDMVEAAMRRWGHPQATFVEKSFTKKGKVTIETVAADPKHEDESDALWLAEALRTEVGGR